MTTSHSPSMFPRGTGPAPLAITEQARLLVEPEMRSAVASLEPGLARAVGYHLGWYEANGHLADMSSGKSVRPALTLLAAACTGVPPRTALPGAVAVELVHNFSLIHDDVMDRDEFRRHRPTVWRTFGMATAILAGDALHSLAFAVLDHDGSPHLRAATVCLSDCLIELASGQSVDMAFTDRPWQGPDAVALPQYRAMAEGKSGALLGCAAEIGAILAGAPEEVSRAFRQAGRHFGLAFQCMDDVIGIWGDPAQTGKPVFADIRERKKTYPILAALAAPGPEAAELARLLHTPLTAEADLRAVAELVAACGGRRRAEEESERQLSLGMACLDRAGVAGAARAGLTDFVDFLAVRTR